MRTPRVLLLSPESSKLRERKACKERIFEAAANARPAAYHGAVETVGFTRMADGTAEDYQILARAEEAYVQALPDRLLEALERLRTSFTGYQVTRYEHSLQSATRALRDGRDEEYVVGALLHDIGDELAPYTHGQMVAAILRPYIRPEVCWIVEHHGVFQIFHYGRHTGDDPNARERYRGHEWFDACAEFCELYDQNCFDPAYDSLPVETFEPMVRRVFAEVRYLGASVS
jgi:predicted HD phosphohydrolase